MSATVNVFPSPASLNVQTNWPRRVLDFDAVHNTVRALDVARALLAFARPRRGSLEIRPEVATAFLSEYERSRALSEPERQALPTLLTLSFMPRVEKCELLTAEGGDASAWTAERVEATWVLAKRRRELLRMIAARGARNVRPYAVRATPRR